MGVLNKRLTTSVAILALKPPKAFNKRLLKNGWTSSLPSVFLLSLSGRPLIMGTTLRRTDRPFSIWIVLWIWTRAAMVIQRRSYRHLSAHVGEPIFSAGGVVTVYDVHAYFVAWAAWRDGARGASSAKPKVESFVRE